MAANPYMHFFLEPASARQRRYEILRARFAEGLHVKDIAARFGMSAFSVETMIRDFKAGMDGGEPPVFFVAPKPGPKSDRKKPLVLGHVLRLRRRYRLPHRARTR